MEHQETINSLGKKQNEPSKFWTKNLTEISYEWRGSYDKDNHIKFKNSVIRSTVYSYGDVYILLNGAIIIDGEGDDDAEKLLDKRNKGVIFLNCPPFAEYISNIFNTQIDNAKDIDVMMPIYNLIEYSNNYSKTSGSLWQYYGDDPNDNITQSESFKSMI